MVVILPVVVAASAVAPGAQDEKRGKPGLPQICVSRGDKL
jgi:hypothetical protein